MTNRYHILETMKLGRLFALVCIAYERMADAMYMFDDDKNARYNILVSFLAHTLAKRLEEVDDIQKER